MDLRSPRNLFCGVVKSPGARCLAVIPVGAGEILDGIRLSGGAFSLPSVDAAASFLGPYGLIEYNAYAIFVPWHVVSTFSGGASEGNVGGVPAPPQSSADWDTLFDRLMLSFGADGSQFYGGNPDGASSATYDVIGLKWRRRGDLVDKPGDPQGDQELHDRADSAEPVVSYGPMGIQRLWSREQILSPSSTASLIKSLTGVAGATATVFGSAIDLQDLVFKDQFEESIPAMVTGPGFLLIGIVRYKVTAAPGHAPTYVSNAAADTEAEWAVNRAMNAFFAGDVSRIQKLIEDYDTTQADWLRGLLFGGDVNLEQSQNLLPDGLDGWGNAATDTWYRENDMVFYGKVFAGLQTPYRMGSL